MYHIRISNQIKKKPFVLKSAKDKNDSSATNLCDHKPSRLVNILIVVFMQI